MNFIIFITHHNFPAAAGFTQEWQSASGDRVTRRQIEVQANDANNPSHYRTVTTDNNPDPAFQPPEEESKTSVVILNNNIQAC